MQKIVIYGLILTICFSQLKQIAVFIDFKINQDFISTVLCINKEKPELKCEGQCHLIKQLSKIDSDEKETTLPTSKKKTERTLQLYLDNQSDQINSLYSFLLNRHSNYQFLYVDPFECDIFRPPEAS